MAKKESDASVRGKILRELITTVNSTKLIGEKFKSGELRKNVVEPAWKCPEGYSNTRFSYEEFEMEWFMEGEPEEGVIRKQDGIVILQLHGGGYIGKMKNTYRSFALLYNRASKGAPVLSVDYRVAPEDPYPAALVDAIAAYEWLLGLGYSADDMIFAGDSAGGGLVLALCLYLKDHDRELPRGIITMSAWTDLATEGASYRDNFELDPLFGNATDSLVFHSQYVPEFYSYKNPYISPIYGNFEGFPPMLMQVGEYEMLLSDTLSVAAKAKKAGVKVRRSVYKGMFHVFQMAMLLMPESRKAWVEVEKFMEQVMQP